MAKVLLKHNTKLQYMIAVIARAHTYTWLHKEYDIQQTWLHKEYDIWLATEGQPLHIPPN